VNTLTGDVLIPTVEVSATAPDNLLSIWADTSEQGDAVLPLGGAAGQSLVKVSGDDYDTAWADRVASVNGQTGAVTVQPGGLIAVKSALKTDTETFTSVSAGANVTVSGLSIVHEVENSANRLIITAFFGAAASTTGLGRVGIAVHDGTSLLAMPASPGGRTATTAGGNVAGSATTAVVAMPSVTFVHTPGAGSKTYTVRAVNVRNATVDIFINRRESEGSNFDSPRTVSALVIQEVAV
jgi:hypothetical protein